MQNTFFIGPVHDDESHNSEILLGIQVSDAGNETIKFNVDSGAQVNILPKFLFKASLNHIPLRTPTCPSALLAGPKFLCWESASYVTTSGLAAIWILWI